MDSSFALRRVVRAKRLLSAISQKDLDNLRNRLEAAEKSPDYNARNHVDVPSDLLRDLLDYMDLHREGMRP